MNVTERAGDELAGVELTGAEELATSGCGDSRVVMANTVEQGVDMSA